MANEAYTRTNQALFFARKAIEKGADGLVLHPYFEGERTPNLPDATATLTGLTQETAAQALEQVGLKVGTVTSRNDPALDAGIVIAADPAGGDQVAVGSSVDLVVAEVPVQFPGVSACPRRLRTAGRRRARAGAQKPGRRTPPPAPA